jgi:hypothetical protein
MDPVSTDPRTRKLAGKSLAKDLATLHPRKLATTVKVILDGVDLISEQGSLRIAHGRILSGQDSEVVKVRFWVPQDKADDLVKELVHHRHPDLKVEVSDITAVL